MKVNLKRNWFDGFRYWETKNNPNEMDDDLRDILPADAEIEKERKPPADPAEKAPEKKKL